MFVRTAAVALIGLTLWAAKSPAQDLGAKVFRLGDLSATADDNQDDTVLVGRGGHGGHHGGFHGGHHHGGFHHSGFRGYYGGYRGYYSGYRGYYGGYGFYRPYSYGYYRPYYRSYYYSTPYYYPSYSYYYYPCATGTTLNGGFAAPQAPAQTFEPMTKPGDEYGPGGSPTPSVPPIPREEGTFPYDGGPRAPVPMPSAEPQPQKMRPIDPTQGRIVSLPAHSTKFVYPAYGEKTPPPAFASDRPTLVKDDPAKASRR